MVDDPDHAKHVAKKKKSSLSHGHWKRVHSANQDYIGEDMSEFPSWAEECSGLKWLNNLGMCSETMNTCPCISF